MERTLGSGIATARPIARDDRTTLCITVDDSTGQLSTDGRYKFLAGYDMVVEQLACDDSPLDNPFPSTRRRRVGGGSTDRTTPCYRLFCRIRIEVRQADEVIVGSRARQNALGGSHHNTVVVSGCSADDRMCCHQLGSGDPKALLVRVLQPQARFWRGGQQPCSSPGTRSVRVMVGLEFNMMGVSRWDGTRPCSKWGLFFRY